MSAGGQSKPRLREQVAAEVRAWMGRRMTNGAKLAKHMGKSEMYVSRRLRGEIPFDMDDLEVVAEYLDVPVSRLLAGAADGRVVATIGEERAPVTLRKAVKPFGQVKRSEAAPPVTRPPSYPVEPAADLSTRRPAIVKPSRRLAAA